MRRGKWQSLVLTCLGATLVTGLTIIALSVPVKSYTGICVCRDPSTGRMWHDHCSNCPTASSSGSSGIPRYTPQYTGCSKAGHAFANLAVAHMTRTGRGGSSGNYNERRAIAISNRGVNYASRGDFRTAIKLYRRALAIRPGHKLIRYNLSVSLNAMGIREFKNGNYQSAIDYFKQALKYAPNRQAYRENLRLAREALTKKTAMGRTEGARQEARLAILRAQARRRAEEMKRLAMEENRRELGRLKRQQATKLNQEVLTAEREFRSNRAQWLRRKQAQVKAFLHRGRKWVQSVKVALRSNIDPVEDHRPKKARDLLPGDILLVAPDGAVSSFIKVADGFYSGRWPWNAKVVQSPVSHALTYIGRGKMGQPLFLDNQMREGPRIIGWMEYHRRYGHRQQYVAKIVKPVDGKVLLSYARQVAADSAKKRWRFGSAYGVLLKDVVCSETAGVAVGLATGIKLANQGGRFIDITPGDFFDNNKAGKYFIVSRFNFGTPPRPKTGKKGP